MEIGHDPRERGVHQWTVVLGLIGGIATFGLYQALYDSFGSITLVLVPLLIGLAASTAELKLGVGKARSALTGVLVILASWLGLLVVSLFVVMAFGL